MPHYFGPAVPLWRGYFTRDNTMWHDKLLHKLPGDNEHGNERILVVYLVY